ncbi:MAG: M20/M25/M40 family metallo-hydrolase [bacterium]
MFETYIKLLKEYVSFKSISTDMAYKGEINKTVEWLDHVLTEYGFTVEIWPGKVSNPVVYASLVVSPELPTVLIYGHYDVQPGALEDGWKSNPFELAMRNGRLYARGVVDNKGQNLIHIVTVGELHKARKLAYNVKFMIEGNEETSNPEIPELVKKMKDKLTADHVMISDGEITGNSPTIETSLRGGFNMTVTLTTGITNLHSGLFGGAVPSSSYELTKILSGLFDKNNKVTIPGFYTDAPIISNATKNSNKKIQSEKDILKIAGVKSLLAEKGLDFFTQTGLRPTIQITGIKTGYIGEGYANIVPAQAEARLNIRLTGTQKPNFIFAQIVKYLKDNTPKYAKIEISRSDFSHPVFLNVDRPESMHVRKLLKEAYGKEPIVKYVGGGIPIVSDFKNILKKETLLVSFGNDDCNMHGLDENFRVDLVKKGLEFSKLFFSKN